MYKPVKDGMEKHKKWVSYRASKQPKGLRDFVDVLWKRKAENQLNNCSV